jgi:Ca2+-binding RTX toxin-like protein
MAWRLAAVVALVVAALAGTALAGSVNGTRGDDDLRGTRGDDTMRGRAGDDLLAGRRGDDVLIGGAGADAMAGGTGEDRCMTDAADPEPTNCEDVRGPAGPLRLTDTTGTDRCLILRRADLCYFALEGSGADASTGTIAASGGVALTSEQDRVTVRNGDWSATGTYSCESDGALAVTIGAETVSAPVDCSS